MWRITALLARAESLPAEPFAERMRESVADSIAAVLQDEPGVRRVNLSLPPEDLDPALAGAIRHDSLLEIWCESEDDAVRAADALRVNGAVASAVDAVLDGARGVAWLAEAVPQKPDEGGRTRVKFLGSGDVAEGLTVAEAQRYWREEHPRVVQTVPAVWNTLTHYTQFHGRETPAIDLGDHIARTRFVPMCADMGFAHLSDIIALFSHPDYLRVVRPDEEKFGRPGDMLAFATDHEVRIVGSSAPGRERAENGSGKAANA